MLSVLIWERSKPSIYDSNDEADHLTFEVSFEAKKNNAAHKLTDAVNTQKVRSSNSMSKRL